MSASPDSSVNVCPKCGDSRDPEGGPCPRCAARRLLAGGASSSGKHTRPDGDEAGLVLGDYELIDPLGAGGMGRVFRARDVKLGRIAAVKLMHGAAAVSPLARDRFRAEARTLARIDHPHVVKCWGHGEDDGVPWMAMQFVEGEPLSAFLAAQPGGAVTRAQQETTARIAAQAARALHAVHTHGVLHRDIKPANIILRGADHLPVLVDFGLARDAGEEGLTLTGETMGTAGWMPPEVIEKGGRAATPWGDLYSLGVVLYQLLCGQLPFGRESPVAVRDRMRAGPPLPPGKVRPGVSRELEAICLRCLEMEPARRYGSCQALADDLEAWLERRPVSARPPGTVRRAWLWCRWHPAAASAIVLLLAGVTALAADVWRERQRLAAEAGRAARARREAVREAFASAVSAHSRHDGPGFTENLTRFQRLAGEDGGWDAGAQVLRAITENGRIAMPGAVCLNAGGETLGIGYEDGTITLCDAAGKVDVRLPPPFGPVPANGVAALCLGAGTDQRSVIAGYQRTGVCAWQERTHGSGTKQWTFSVIDDAADHIIPSHDHRLLFFSCPQTQEGAGVRIRDADGKLIRTLPGGSGAIAHACRAPVFAQAMPGNMIRVWNSGDFSLKAELATGGPVASLAVSPEGNRIAWTETGAAQIHVSEARELEGSRYSAPVALTGGSRAPSLVSFCVEGNTLACGGTDGLLDLWPMDDDSGRRVTLHAHRGAVLAVGFLRGASQPHTIGSDSFLALPEEALPWSERLDDPVFEAGAGLFCRSVRIPGSDVSEAVAVRQPGGQSKAFTLPPGPPSLLAGVTRPDIFSFVTRPLGAAAARGLRQVSAGAGAPAIVREIPLAPAARDEEARAERWLTSPDRQHLAAWRSLNGPPGAAPQGWVIRSAADGRILWQHTLDQSRIVRASQAMAFSPDSKWICLAAETLDIRDAMSGRSGIVISSAGAYAFSPDSSFCAVMTGSLVRVMRCGTWETTQEVPVPQGTGDAICFAGNHHTLLLTGTGSAGLCVLDLRGSAPALSPPLLPDQKFVELITSGNPPVIGAVGSRGPLRIFSAPEPAAVTAPVTIRPPVAAGDGALRTLRFTVGADNRFTACRPSPSLAERKWAQNPPRPFGAPAEGGASWRHTFAPLPERIASARLTIHLRKPPLRDLRCSAHSRLYIGSDPDKPLAAWTDDVRLLCDTAAADGAPFVLTLDLTALQRGGRTVDLRPLMISGRCLDVVIGSLGSVRSMELEIETDAPLPDIPEGAENPAASPDLQILPVGGGNEVATGSAPWQCTPGSVQYLPFSQPQGWLFTDANSDGTGTGDHWIGPGLAPAEAARTPVTFTCRFDAPDGRSFRAWVWSTGGITRISLNGRRLPRQDSPPVLPHPDTPVMIHADDAALLRPAGNELRVTVQGPVPAILVKGGVEQ